MCDLVGYCRAGTMSIHLPIMACNFHRFPFLLFIPKEVRTERVVGKQNACGRFGYFVIFYSIIIFLHNSNVLYTVSIAYNFICFFWLNFSNE